jgi:hypothetical protein
MDQPPVRFPLVEPLENRDFSTSEDAKILNGIVEQSTRGTLRVIKRPGQRVAFQGTPGTGQGIDNYLNNLYSISGDVLNAFGASSVVLTAQQVTGSAGFTPRTDAMGIGFQGKLWIFGGFNATGVPLNDIWSSVDGLAWTNNGTAAWFPRGGAGVIVFNNILYLIGGATGVGSGNVIFGDVWSSPDGLTWTQINAGAVPPRFNFGLTSSSSVMYVAGGTAGPASNGAGQTFYSDVWSSPDGISWTRLTKAAPWVARDNFGFFWLNNKLFVVGGQLSDPFHLATSDLWSSPDGTVWTRVSANPFGVAASGVWPIAAFYSNGVDFPIPSPITVTGGTGGTGATAWAFTDPDDDFERSPFDLGNYLQLTFNNVGSGYTGAPTLTFGTNVGVEVGAYALLDGTANGGAKQLQATILNGTIYLLEYNASGTDVERIWSTTDGVTYTNTNTNFAQGWPVRSGGAFFGFGNLWEIGGEATATSTFFNDVWAVDFVGLTIPLNPNVPNGFYHFTQTSTSITTPLLVFKSTHDLYSFNSALNALTKLSNVPNYPTVTVPGIVYLDTFFFVMDVNGNILNSNQNDPSTWTALGTIAMENEPNGGVAIAKYLNYVVGFGVWSMEFFADAGALPPGSPLLPNTSLPSLVGCAAGESVIEMQNSVVWIGQTRREGASVYMIQNYMPLKISTAFVDRILQNDPLTSVSAFSVDQFGHSCYVLTLHTSNITLVYSFDSGMWTMFTSNTQNDTQQVTLLEADPYGTVTAIVPGNGAADGDPVVISGATIPDYNGIFNITVVDQNTFTYQIQTAPVGNPGNAGFASFTENAFRPVASAQVMDVDYLQDPVSGAVYAQDSTDVTDNGGPINLEIVTDRYDGGITQWKVCRRITLVADIQPFNVMVSYSDNDYQTFSASRFMSTQQGQRATVTPAGRFRRRAFKIRHTEPVAFRAEALELEIILGSF